MADPKKVEKTAESTGFQNVGTSAMAPPADTPKTLIEARAAKQVEDGALADAQAKVRAEVAERDKNPPEPKPSKSTQAEMARGAKN